MADVALLRASAAKHDADEAANAAREAVASAEDADAAEMLILSMQAVLVAAWAAMFVGYYKLYQRYIAYCTYRKRSWQAAQEMPAGRASASGAPRRSLPLRVLSGALQEPGGDRDQALR